MEEAEEAAGAVGIVEALTVDAWAVPRAAAAEMVAMAAAEAEAPATVTAWGKPAVR